MEHDAQSCRTQCCTTCCSCARTQHADERASSGLPACLLCHSQPTNAPSHFYPMHVPTHCHTLPHIANSPQTPQTQRACKIFRPALKSSGTLKVPAAAQQQQQASAATAACQAAASTSRIQVACCHQDLTMQILLAPKNPSVMPMMLTYQRLWAVASRRSPPLQENGAAAWTRKKCDGR